MGDANFSAAPQLRYCPHELQSHISFNQWHHLISLIHHLRELNRHKNGTSYELHKSIFNFKPDKDLFKKGHYKNKADFDFKLRDTYYWWSHKVLGKLGQRKMGVTRQASKNDPGFVLMFYIFCYGLRTLLFTHKSSKKARLAHLDIPPTFIELIKGDNRLQRHKEWGVRFNKCLERLRQLNRTDLILVPPIVFEDACLAIFSTIYQCFNCRESYYAAASLHGENKYADSILQDVRQHPDVIVLQQWLKENMEEHNRLRSMEMEDETTDKEDPSPLTSTLKWDNIATRIITILSITAIQTRKKQLGVERSQEGFRPTLAIKQEEGSLKRAKKDKLVRVETTKTKTKGMSSSSSSSSSRK